MRLRNCRCGMWVLLLLALISIDQSFAIPDPYKVLGVSKDASEAQIKSAYRKLALKYHPDKNQDNKKAKNKFLQIGAAYELLSDPTRKKTYDEQGFDPEDKSAEGRQKQQQQQGFGGGGGGGGFGGGGGGFGGGFPGGGFGFENFFGGGGGGGGGRQQQHQQHFGGGGGGGGEPEPSPFKKTSVVLLDDSTYTPRVKDGVWLINFHKADSVCPECAKLTSMYKKLVTTLKDYTVTVAAVDCHVSKKLCETYSVTTFPTFKVATPAQRRHLINYEGAHTAKALKDFATRFLPDKQVTVVTSANYESFLADETLPKVLVFSENAKISATLRALSLRYDQRLKFGQVAKKESTVVDFFKVKTFPSIMFQKDTNSDPQWYKGEFQLTALVSYFKSRASATKVKPRVSRQESNPLKPSKRDVKSAKDVQPIPEMGLVSGDWDRACVATGKICVVALLPLDFQAHTDMLYNLAVRFRNDPLVFVWASAYWHPKFVESFGVEKDSVPRLLACKFKRGQGRHVIMSGDFEPGTIATFLEDVLSGSKMMTPFASPPSF